MQSKMMLLMSACIRISLLGMWKVYEVVYRCWQFIYADETRQPVWTYHYHPHLPPRELTHMVLSCSTLTQWSGSQLLLQFVILLW